LRHISPPEIDFFASEAEKTASELEKLPPTLKKQLPRRKNCLRGGFSRLDAVFMKSGVISMDLRVSLMAPFGAQKMTSGRAKSDIWEVEKYLPGRSKSTPVHPCRTMDFGVQPTSD
jgi:hypothetical protein